MPRKDASAPRKRVNVASVGDTALHVHAHGTAFGGATFDAGSRLLVDTITQLPEFDHTASVLDLGCGNGSISAYLVLKYPQLHVHAVDDSGWAVASTRATAQACGILDRITLTQDDAGSSLPESDQEIVVLNPPFHEGNAVSARIAHHLFDATARLLSPGGKLYCVWNSHMRYRAYLQRTVGPTTQLARNSTYTVTVSARPAAR